MKNREILGIIGNNIQKARLKLRFDTRKVSRRM